MTRLGTPADLTKLRDQIIAQRNAKETWLAICAGTGCRAQRPKLGRGPRKRDREARLGDKVECAGRAATAFASAGPWW